MSLVWVAGHSKVDSRVWWCVFIEVAVCGGLLDKLDSRVNPVFSVFFLNLQRENCVGVTSNGAASYAAELWENFETTREQFG